MHSMKIDVVMPTYNSNKWYFKYVLRRLKEEIRVNKLIVIDKFSSDGTISVIREYFPDALIIQTRANLAYARYIGIKLVETEWFLFNDDDAIIIPGAVRRAKKLMQIGKIGAIELGTFGLKASNSIHLTTIPNDEKPILFIKKSIHDVTIDDAMFKGLMYLTRGFTFSTFVRKDIVIDWKPHPNLGAFEDYSLTQHIINKGYLWVLIDEPLVFHVGWYAKDYLTGTYNQIRKALWHSSSLRYVDIPHKMILTHSLARIISSLKNMVINTLRKRGTLEPILDLTWHLAFIISMPISNYAEIKR